MNSFWGHIADLSMPGELLRLVADGLADSGLEVRPPEHGVNRRLIIASAGARCTVAVTDWGYAELEYCPCPGYQADPKQLADVATVLLTGRAEDFPRLGRGYGLEGITLKGIVGLELQARGLEVALAVYPDEEYFDTDAEIVVTNPRGEADEKVLVTDEGDLTWVRRYRNADATSVSEPDWWVWTTITDRAPIAAAIVGTVTRASAYLRLAG